MTEISFVIGGNAILKLWMRGFILLLWHANIHRGLKLITASVGLPLGINLLRRSRKHNLKMLKKYSSCFQYSRARHIKLSRVRFHESNFLALVFKLSNGKSFITKITLMLLTTIFLRSQKIKPLRAMHCHGYYE